MDFWIAPKRGVGAGLWEGGGTLALLDGAQAKRRGRRLGQQRGGDKSKHRRWLTGDQAGPIVGPNLSTMGWQGPEGRTKGNTTWRRQSLYSTLEDGQQVGTQRPGESLPFPLLSCIRPFEGQGNSILLEFTHPRW